MGETVLINVCLTGGENDIQPEILLIPENIAWIDFEAMLKAHFDCGGVSVLYVDSDNDEVSINSEEEMMEALRVAKRAENCLNVKVTQKSNDVKAPPKQEENEQNNSTKLHQKLRSVHHLLDNIADGDADMEETGEVDPSLLNRDAETGTITVKKLKRFKKPEIYAVVEPGSRKHFSHGASAANSEIVKPKTKKPSRDVYQEVATEIGNEKKKSMAGAAAGQDSEYVEISNRQDQNVPYDMFVGYMEKLKSELRTEIVKDVTRKTVKHVLKGLDTNQRSHSADRRTAPYPQHYHEGITCSNCQKVIMGIRYKCGNCSDYDLCEVCEDIYGIHDSTHVFLKLRLPCKGAGDKENGKRPLLKRILYRDPVMEQKFKKLDKEPAAPESRKDRIIEKMAKVEEKFRRKDEKLQRKEEKLQERLRRKEEKLKRKLDVSKDDSERREKLDLPQFKKPYFDLSELGGEFICDETIPDGTMVQPNTKLLKTWRLKNSGKIPWTSRTRLRLLWGVIPTFEDAVPVPLLQPNEEGNVSVILRAPSEAGKYQSHWKLDESGYNFGHRVWCSIIVEPKEVLEPTNDEQAETLQFVKNESEDQDKVTIIKPEDKVEVPVSEVSKPHCVPEENSEQQVAGEDVDDSEKDKIESDLSSAAAAVAQLKLKDVDVENNQDLLSFEMVDTRTRDTLKASHTATPNNTPLDVTPPKSPAPEVLTTREMSNSSSVELVPDNTDEQDDDGYDMTEYVRERIQNLGLKPELDIDLESLSSSGDDSSDVSDDFYIVPLPDCFDTSKPLSHSMITAQNLEIEIDDNHNTVITADDHVSLDDILKPSESVPTPTLDPIIQEASLKEEDIVTLYARTAEIEISVPEQVIKNETPAECEIEVKEYVKNDNTEEQRVEEIIESSVDPVSSTSETMIKEVTKCNTESEAAASNTDKVKNGHQTHTVPSSPGVELVDQFMSTAVHAATKAAIQVYGTCKDVFQTLQAKQNDKSQTGVKSTEEKVAYPQKNWIPSKNSWTPPKSDWSPPEDKFVPPQSDWQPPKEKEETIVKEWEPPANLGPMERLMEMGFCNRKLNAELLEKHQNDTERVVQELLNIEDSDWQNGRH